MYRRNFIKVIGIGTGIILLPSFLISNSEIRYKKIYGIDEKDIRLNILSYAILAPSAHNIQPWLIKFTSKDTMDLYVDTTRLLPLTDPYYRQIHISQGAFIENFIISASYFGYKVTIDYFPQGEYNNLVLENKPVASLKLIKDFQVKKDTLFEFIIKRQTNKSIYNSVSIDTKLIDTITQQSNGLYATNHILQFSNSKENLNILKQVAIKAMEIEASNKKRNLETIEMFRFNSDEIDKYKDGLTIAQTGTTGIKKWFLETFILSRESYMKNPNSFGKEAVEITKNQVNSTNTFAWLTTKGNTRLEQVKIGRIYGRINILATSLGVQLHPISQILQEYPDMENLQKKFLNQTNTKENETVQMFFRVGFANNIEHSPRRNIQDILI